VVRRVRRDNPPGQRELLLGYRYYVFVTDTTFSTVKGHVDLNGGGHET